MPNESKTAGHRSYQADLDPVDQIMFDIQFERVSSAILYGYHEISDEELISRIAIALQARKAAKDVTNEPR